ncbi:MAG: hypothetical protein AB7F75_06050 [Planctomycetota bacterium]
MTVLLLGGLASLAGAEPVMEGSEPTDRERLEAAGRESHPVDILTWRWQSGRVEETRHLIAQARDLPSVPSGARIIVSRSVERSSGDLMVELRWHRTAVDDSGPMAVSRPGWRIRRILMHPVNEAPNVVEDLLSIHAPVRSQCEEQGWRIRKWEGQPGDPADAGSIRWATPVGTREQWHRYLADHEAFCQPGEESRRLACHLGTWQDVYGVDERDFADQCYHHVLAHIRPQPSVRGGEESLKAGQGDITAALVCLLRAGGIPARVVLARSMSRFPESLDAIDVERGGWSARGVMAYPNGKKRVFFPETQGLAPHEVPVSCRGSSARVFSQGILHTWRLPLGGREPLMRRTMRLELSSGQVQVEKTEEGERHPRISSKSPARGVLLDPEVARSVDKTLLTTWAKGVQIARGMVPPLTPLHLPHEVKGGVKRVKEDLLLIDELIVEGDFESRSSTARTFRAPGIASHYEVVAGPSNLRITRRVRWRAGILRGTDLGDTLGVLRKMRDFEEGLSGTGS